ncbi:hypothetical protein Caci_9013 [Catenulispora acidiphila DSM 44928]|uniref:N-acetyltransferase domain-containing protein n=1 Tax=Catenulispora acidiphila (strain DSM 44928 / JCM 14897 / NBRC 102108 / NRRL B-24433 / ID139908) TaxID=479433 RepID=C7Q5L5_CATAD|nr:hypothetical protein [Catenulispora acidiphila]ACU77826.1 hypothetical protein Caci_9013 [Catenulispora acidiphila DSM 44928]
MKAVDLYAIRLDIGSMLHLGMCDGERTDEAPRWFVQIMLEDGDEPDAEPIQIGHMQFLMVDEAMVGRVFDSLDALDGHASRHAEVILALADDAEAPVEMPFGPYLIVESVQLDEPYRGRGLGTYLTGMAIKMIGPGCDIVTVYPFPLDTQRDEDGVAVEPATSEAMAAIGRSWERLGFRPYRLGVYVLDRRYATFEKSLSELPKRL